MYVTSADTSNITDPVPYVMNKALWICPTEISFMKSCTWADMCTTDRDSFTIRLNRLDDW